MFSEIELFYYSIIKDYCMEPFTTVLSEGIVVVPAQNEASSLYQDGFGSNNPDRGTLTLESFEALYLLDRGKISVIDEESRERLAFRTLLSKYKPYEKDTWISYIVYRDIRIRGFVARSGPGWGIDFYIYERGSFGKKPPSDIIYTVWEGAPETINNLKSIHEMTEDENRNLRLAVVDRRGELVYYTLTELLFNERFNGIPLINSPV